MEKKEQLSDSRSLYFVGIGGAGMYPLARLAHSLGFCVSGCERAENENTARLRRLGLAIHKEGEDARAERDATVVYTLAAPDTHPVLREARAQGQEMLTRAAFLGRLSTRFTKCAAVAGTHGKSSTVGFCTSVLRTAGLSPTVLCGADLTKSDGGFLSGGKELLLVEACEYKRAFLSLAPTHALALGADYEHPDCYGSEEEVKEAFLAYLSLPSVQTRVAPVGFCEDAVSFGKGGVFSFQNLTVKEGRASFELFREEKSIGSVRLSVLGAFQAQNALAAAALCYTLGATEEDIVLGLSSFHGIAGRMQLCGWVKGVPVYLDYAHHPTELSAALACASTIGKKVTCLFEGHTYSRVFAFRREFARLLALPHYSGVLPIFSARETETMGMSGEAMAREAGADYIPSYCSASEYVLKRAEKSDVILLVGAGEIGKTLSYLRNSEAFLPVKV